MSMTIDYTTEVRAVRCITAQGDLTDVVKYIEWDVRFFDISAPDTVSIASINTELDTDNVSSDSFIAFGDVTKANLAAWGLAKHGGTDFLDGLLDGGHAARLEELLRIASYTPKDVDLIPAT